MYVPSTASKMVVAVVVVVLVVCMYVCVKRLRFFFSFARFSISTIRRVRQLRFFFFLSAVILQLVCRGVWLYSGLGKKQNKNALPFSVFPFVFIQGCVYVRLRRCLCSLVRCQGAADCSPREKEKERKKRKQKKKKENKTHVESPQIVPFC